MSNLLEFKNKIEEKVKSDKILKGESKKTDNHILNFVGDISFHLCYHEYLPLQISGRHLISVINLDEEDLEYFKNKYFKKLDEELNNKISDLKKQYGTEQ